MQAINEPKTKIQVIHEPKTNIQAIHKPKTKIQAINEPAQCTLLARVNKRIKSTVQSSIKVTYIGRTNIHLSQYLLENKLEILIFRHFSIEKHKTVEYKDNIYTILCSFDF